jgi:hypothetical protein
MPYAIHLPYESTPLATLESIDDCLELIGERENCNWARHLTTKRYADGSHSVIVVRTRKLLPYSLVETDHYQS